MDVDAKGWTRMIFCPVVGRSMPHTSWKSVHDNRSPENFINIDDVKGRTMLGFCPSVRRLRRKRVMKDRIRLWIVRATREIVSLSALAQDTSAPLRGERVFAVPGEPVCSWETSC